MPMALNGIVTEHRGSEPTDWEHSTMTPSITFTWHHTIPWNCLREVWNGLVRGKHWDAVSEYLGLIGAASVPVIVQGLKAGALTVDRDALLTQLTWQGWNIVEGPGNEYRAEGDDPGEAFDSWSGESMSGNQKATLLAVKSLYINAMRPVALLNNVDGTNASKVAKAMRSARPTLRGKAPIKWNEDMWTVVTAGRVSDKVPGIWYTKPTWQRR